MTGNEIITRVKKNWGQKYLFFSSELTLLFETDLKYLFYGGGGRGGHSLSFLNIILSGWVL